ncbi:MAG: gliding motility-associated C-terminal domain-containing protein [Bacteroidaceae bacterium]|nr:gliding motility-associated C-terminal domain-containing protein [Bacteroidaceae bacterium]
MNRTKQLYRLIAIILIALTTISVKAQKFSVVGGNELSYAYYEEYNSTSTINAVYIVYGTADKSLQFETNSGNSVIWYTYEDVLTPLASEQNGRYSTIPLTQSECGFIAMDGDKPYYIYVIDYIKNQLSLTSVTTDGNEAACDIITLNIQGAGEKMNYYAFNNKMPYEVKRDITIAYNSLEWDEEMLQYNEVVREVVINQFSSSYPVAAPLCNTIFTVRGDKFLEAWGMEQIVESAEYTTVAVEAQAQATQTYREAANEIDRQPENLGGSAPAEIEFNAYYTDAVTHVEWQFSQDANFNTITHRYTDDLLRYTFREEGTTYVRLVVTSNNESCIYESEPMVVTIGTSMLEIPNAFSPGTIDGKNDEWRVAFKSLVEFRCWIFNKQGVEMYYSENPGEGWDGKHAGRLASPGVYYYVIEARGADGTEYKRSGHINLMRSKKNAKSNNNE